MWRPPLPHLRSPAPDDTQVLIDGSCSLDVGDCQRSERSHAIQSAILCFSPGRRQRGRMGLGAGRTMLQEPAQPNQMHTYRLEDRMDLCVGPASSGKAPLHHRQLINATASRE